MPTLWWRRIFQMCIRDRMEVPCCGGIQRAAETAVARSGRDIPLRTVVVGTDGRLR